jgi:hypothetical protein
MCSKNHILLAGANEILPTFSVSSSLDKSGIEDVHRTSNDCGFRENRGSGNLSKLYLGQCFSNRIPRNLRVPQNNFRGSERNIVINTLLFEILQKNINISRNITRICVRQLEILE